MIDRFAAASLRGISDLARATEAGLYDGLWLAENRHEPFGALTPAAAATLPRLEHRGLGELQSRLDGLARDGRWEDMGALIPQELIDAMVVTGRPDEIARGCTAAFSTCG